MKARIWVGNCFCCGLELGKTYFELVCQKRNFFPPNCFWVLGNNAFLVKPIYWIVFLDWVMQWITKMEHFLGMMYFF